MTSFLRELIHGKRPARRTNRKQGESEWFYFDPRGTDRFSEMKTIDVPTQDTPNPYADEIQNYLYENDEYNYKELYGDTPPPAQKQAVDYSLYGEGFSQEFIDNMLADTDYQRALNEYVIPNEKGYVNNPRDPGGETNMGIAKRYHPNEDIKNLTRGKSKCNTL